MKNVTSYFEDSWRVSLNYDGASIFERDGKCMEQGSC